jgi:hypothetical protein
MFHYDTQDRATRIGCMLADVFLIVFGVLFIWAIFGRH